MKYITINYICRLEKNPKFVPNLSWPLKNTQIKKSKVADGQGLHYMSRPHSGHEQELHIWLTILHNHTFLLTICTHLGDSQMLYGTTFHILHCNQTKQFLYFCWKVVPQKNKNSTSHHWCRCQKLRAPWHLPLQGLVFLWHLHRFPLQLPVHVHCACNRETLCIIAAVRKLNLISEDAQPTISISPAYRSFCGIFTVTKESSIFLLYLRIVTFYDFW